MNYKLLIRTRIAPSPTGPFHLGTARTALINYIFAKQNKGEFLLRMEDTDATRNQPEFEEDIKNGLSWLGLDWDGEIVYQKNRGARYREIVSELIKKDSAYQKDGAVWLHIPKNEKVKFDDLIRGQVEINSDDLKDFVILRSDSSPIFYLSGVVDDYDSQITHVIRGEEHLSNTAKQILILQALGWNIPQYAHLPLILNPDRSKMSKRKDPVSITRDFKDQGYLSEAMVNYLFLLGFHPTEKAKPELPTKNYEKDIYGLKKMAEIFDIARMQKGGAIFDRVKLDSINHRYIQKLSDSELAKKLEKYRGAVNQEPYNRLIKVIKSRLRKLSDVADDLTWVKQSANYPPQLLVYKDSSLPKTLQALQVLQDKVQAIGTKPRHFEDYHLILKSIVEETDLQTGDIFWSARVALSGLEKSPPPAELMWVLGKEESIKRIKNAIRKIENRH